MYKVERAIHNTTIFVFTCEQQHGIMQGANTGENFYNHYINITMHACTCVLQDAYLRFGSGVCYKLVGVIIYVKLSKTCGHYTSYFLDCNQDKWFYADDEKV